MNFEELHQIIPSKSATWTPTDIEKWLQFINLPNLTTIFRSANINGSTLPYLTENTLKDHFNIPSSIIRKKLMNWVTFGLENFDTYMDTVSEKKIKEVKSEQMIEEEYEALNLRKNVTTCLRNVQNVLNQGSSNGLHHHAIKSKPTMISHQNYSPMKENSLILEQYEGNNLGVYIIKDKIMSIGFGKDNTIHSFETSINDHHALIGQKNGRYILQDLGSKYGTFLKVNHRSLLQVNTIIEIGSYQFRVSSLNPRKRTLELECIIAPPKQEDQNKQNEVSKNQRPKKEKKKENEASFKYNKSKDKVKKEKMCELAKNNLSIDLKESNKFTFGRRKENNFQKNDKHLSGIHCKIVFFNQNFWVEDYGSTNGTWIRLSPPNIPSSEQQVIDGTIIKIGTTITYICRIKNENIPKQNLKNVNQNMIDEQDENRQICKKCLKQENNCLFFPCNHNPVCFGCAESLKHCPQCSQEIIESIQIYK